MVTVVLRVTEQQTVMVWEQGATQHEIDRALTMLMIADPSVTRAEYAEWSIGQRNLQLLKLRENTFGVAMPCIIQCSQCAEPLQFMVNVNDIYESARIMDDITLTESACHQLDVDNVNLSFRLINSLDLAQIAQMTDPTDARQLLIQRCVLQAKANGEEIGVKDLPERVITTLCERLDTLDPLASVCLNHRCSACNTPGVVTFDIVVYLWDEMVSSAKTWLKGVHFLASTYGWSESDILSLSAPRRQYYLERIST